MRIDDVQIEALRREIDQVTDPALRERLRAKLPPQNDPNGWTARTWVSFNHGAPIPVGRTVEIVAQPQRPFRGQRLGVWSTCAPHFLIEGVVTGTTASGLCWGGFPADLAATRLDMLAKLDELAEGGMVKIDINELALDVFGLEMTMPVCQVGMQIALMVFNCGAVPSPFHAAILGVYPTEPSP
jgi:hypothetical protein